MNKFMEVLSEKVLPVATKIGANKYLITLRDAFMVSFPLTMFGSLIVVFNNLPFWPDTLKNNFANLFGNGQSATMSIMTVFVTLAIGYYWAKTEEVEGIFGGVVALASFLILTPFTVLVTGANGKSIEGTGLLSLDRLGAKGMFLGILSAFLAAKIFVWLTKKGYVIKMPDGVPPAVSKSFASLIPALGTLFVFLIINAIMVGVFTTNLHDVIYNLIQKPLTGLGTGLPATIIAIFLVQFLWFFGLHGQVIVNSVFEPFWQTNMLDNASLTQQGTNALAEHGHIVTKSFMDTFTVGLGGSGSTLVVVLLMAFVMKRKQYKEVARLALAPGLFNVNEPVIFGLPMVMNVSLFIPWLLAPIVSVVIAYLGFASGLVPLTTGAQVPWTMPIFISGFLATNSVMGAVLQLVQFLIIGLIWFPFLKAIDNQEIA
ncbi:PTS cellobiose transporter subunit IIC [Lactococcus taiwanensis]|jgi:PTS system cellobiose-specific IIC component|uniref:Permease IIC component n=1 Tax=Lactococcus taiwanensis TaxID=1151742 RepID=A0AA45KHQ5_9LACT|nr:PTS cellobiose transporter subunit IIC [Lactococcus taiwanensis]KZK37941.1 PTS system cellobiose-specific IIC component [Lactococcus cremoris]QRZ11095.1 PTS cellobiose transporter subunit IIC [Lactococcus taiwanensis]QSE76491.1 PTS cellobiose transporter subunit IIC [Lactococcus taiwanensis]